MSKTYIPKMAIMFYTEGEANTYQAPPSQRRSI